MEETLPPPTDDTPATADETRDANAELILLDPARVRLFRTAGQAVRCTVTDAQVGPERSYLSVKVARAFPLSMPDRYIGLRDEKDKDIGMLATLDGIDGESRTVVVSELDRRYFVPKITRVVTFKEEFGNYTFTVETDRGERTFLVQNIRESVVTLTPTRVLLTDKDGERYEIPDVERMDPKTLVLLQRFL